MQSKQSQPGFHDEFEEYKARATSGGSIYGLLRISGKDETTNRSHNGQTLQRRQTTQNRHSHSISPGHTDTSSSMYNESLTKENDHIEDISANESPRCISDDEQKETFRRRSNQRSRSLVPRSAPLKTDTEMLHALYDHTLEEISRMNTEIGAGRKGKRSRRNCNPLDLEVTNERLEVAANKNDIHRKKKSYRRSSNRRSPEKDEGTNLSVYPRHARDRGNSLPYIGSRSDLDMTPVSNLGDGWCRSNMDRRDTLRLPSNNNDMVPSSSPAKNSLAYRRRSFSTTSSGIKNEGDTMLSYTTTTGLSLDKLNDDDSQFKDIRKSCDSTEFSKIIQDKLNIDLTIITPPTTHSIAILGGPGVGKTSLTQQFMTSEYIGPQNISFDTTQMETMVRVLLDGEESILNCVDIVMNEGDDNRLQKEDTRHIEALIIVYSITDRRSFLRAAELLSLGIARQRISDDYVVATILVANKSDLVRSRVVGEKEGKLLAEQFESKYIEVSAALNHRVDHLLVGILKQIRLMKERREKRGSTSTAKLPGGNANKNINQKEGVVSAHSQNMAVKILSRAGHHLLKTCFKSHKRASKSCENLLTL